MRYVLFVLLSAGLAWGFPAPAAAEVVREPGPDTGYDLLFSGNREFSEDALRQAAEEELAGFARMGFRRADIDDAAYRMELAYRRAGFAFATVDYRLSAPAGRPRASFIIVEGPRVRIDKLEIEGNRAFSQKELQAFFERREISFLGQAAPVFVRGNIDSGIEDLLDYYREQGFAEVLAEPVQIRFSEDRSHAAIRVVIREGPRYSVAEIVYRGDLPPETEKSLEELRREFLGKPYHPRRMFQLRSRVEEIYANLGYADAAVAVRDRAETPGRVALDVMITGREAITVRAVSIRGFERTREDFIRSRVRILPGERYSLEKDRESFRELYRTGLFSTVKIRLEDEAGAPERTLAVEVTEAPSRELYLEPGWGSYERLRLKTGFREKNLFGSGVIFGAEAKASVKDQGLEGNLTDPWFLDTDTSAHLSTFYKHRVEPSFTRTEEGASILFTRKPYKHLTLSAGYSLRSTDLTDVGVDELDRTSDEDYDLASLILQGTYDTRNDVFFPTAGLRGHLSAEYASTFLGGDIDFIRLTAGMRSFWQLVPGTVLAARYTTGWIIPASSDVSVPLAERFFNGGENTVRSFNESELGPKDESGDPTGGLAYNVLSIELRQRLIGNFFGSVFCDLGNVAPNRSPSERGNRPYDSRRDILADTFADFFKDFRPGIGIGLQYLTPVGPARIDFAFNPDEDEGREEDDFVIHFSVGMAF
jgi:outer membrane protein assembly complex protein YaeT